MQDLFKTITHYLATNGIDIIIALLIFVVGRWAAKMISKLLSRLMQKAKLDATLVTFVGHLAYFLILVLVIIAALEKAGVKTSSAVVVLGAAGLAIAMAWQGSLSNFASGVLMVIFKPIKVGDFVDIGGAKGTVKDIQILNTVLDSPNNVRIIVPNSQITGSKVENYSANATRRIDLTVGVSYSDDLNKAKKVIQDVLANDSRILKEPAAVVAVFELASSSVNLVVRPWVNNADYWAVYFDTVERIKAALDENGITIPFPQQDIYIKKLPPITSAQGQ